MPFTVRNPWVFGLAILLASCATTGPVETVQSDSTQPVVAAPSAFSSAAMDMDRAERRLTELDDSLDDSASLRSAQWQEYLGWLQAYDTAKAEQDEIEREIEKTGELALTAGRSYSFDLESYCVNAGKSRPVTGDGLRVGLLRGPAEKWITEILERQGQKGVAQDRAQYLIWALLSDTRFDELSEEGQAVLLQFYPDAARRFGNRRLEDLATDALQGIAPDSVSGPFATLSALRQRVIDLRDDYEGLASELAPISDRTVRIPVGWLQMEGGYLLHATSDSYTKIHLDLYVPEDGARGPSSIRPLVFRPWQWIALPAQGQRLALSTKVVRKPARAAEHDPCKKFQDWRPHDCREMTNMDREKLLSAADPGNFTRTRYQSPPRGSKPEDETDCSHFVKEMMKRTGFDFMYAPTQDFQCLRVFKPIPESAALPGDLVLYPGHVGILNAAGKVISATQGGAQKRSELDPKDPKFIPSITINEKSVAGRGQWKILRWSCP